MRLLSTLPLLTSCMFAVIFNCNALFCNPCEETQCANATDCTAGTVMEPCGCCEVCAIPEGEACNTNEFGLCAGGRFCLPDGGLHSNSPTGKCLGITECFSTGCDVVEDACECGYSNTCPSKTFEFGDKIACEKSLFENTTEEVPENCESSGCEIVDRECYCLYSDICPVHIFTYPTEEDCEAALNATSSCDEVQCPQPRECAIGSYYIPGPQLPGECCPSEGMCLCDEKLCPITVVACPEGYQLAVHSANDNKDQCCDTYTCERIVDLNCLFGDQIIENGGSVKPDACTNCKCSNGNLYCATTSCHHVECSSSEELVVRPGDCCPVCQPKVIIDPPPIPVCETEGEFIDPKNPCKLCTCYNGRTACIEQVCEPLACDNPVLLPGVCCPVCEESTTKPSSEAPTEIDTSAAPTTEGTTTAKPTEVSTTINEPLSEQTTAKPTEVSTAEETTAKPTIEMPTTPVEGIVTTPVPTDGTVFPLPTLSRPSSPYTARQCSKQNRPFKSSDDGCLTCVCIDGLERCIDKTQTLCGVPRCDNPVLIQGECCPVCIDNGVHVPSADKSMFVVTLVIGAELFVRYRTNGTLEKTIEDELERRSYSLVDMRGIPFRKAQFELVIVVEQVKSSDTAQDEIASALLERLTAIITTPARNNNNNYRVYPSDNVVIVVCAISILVTVILVTVFCIFLVFIWIRRINKRQRKIRNSEENDYDKPEKA